MIKFRMKQEGPYIDDEKLIEEVFKYRFLYDTKHNDYRNLPLRFNTWNEVASALNVENQNLVQKRWKVLREKYSVAYRKELAEGALCNWIFYDKLKFLNPFVTLKPTDHKSPKANASYSEIPSHITKSPFDELMLIQLIREFPLLYDKKHEDFRSSSLRRKAWDEISSKTNWNVDLLQKRWRVMRDRFVRELRKTQNLDANTQVNCSSFFREMLFLASHVRSSKYEVETNLEDGIELKTVSESGDEIAGEEWIMQEDTTYQDDNYDDSSTQYVEENVEMDQTQNYEEMPASQNDFIDDESTVYESDEKIIIGVDDEENIQETSSNVQQDHFIKTERRSKRNAVEEIDCGSKNKQPRTELKSPSRTFVVDDVNDKDEDIAFGKTLGCMLKKIPAHLKTAVKLKLLSSLADFEAQHNLT